MVAFNFQTFFEVLVLSPVAAIGFAILFNVPQKYLKYTATLAAIGCSLRYILMSCDISIEIATLCGSFCIGTLAIQFSEITRAYPKTISVAAIIPMFPGVHAYKAMTAVVQLAHAGYSPALAEKMISEFLSTTFIVGALSMGLTLPGIWMYRNRARV